MMMTLNPRSKTQSGFEKVIKDDLNLKDQAEVEESTLVSESDISTTKPEKKSAKLTKKGSQNNKVKLVPTSESLIDRKKYLRWMTNRACPRKMKKRKRVDGDGGQKMARKRLIKFLFLHDILLHSSQ